MVVALNRLPNQIKLVGVLNQTCDVHMFTLQPKWLHSVYEHMFLCEHILRKFGCPSTIVTN